MDEEAAGGDEGGRPVRGMLTKHSQYAVIRRVGREMGLRERAEAADWSLLWIDCAVQPGRVAELRPWQVVNHIPRISDICSKDKLVRSAGPPRRLRRARGRRVRAGTEPDADAAALSGAF